MHFLHGAEVSLTLQRSSGDSLELLSDWDEPDWLWAQEIRQGWAACQLFATSGLWAGLQPPQEREKSMGNWFEGGRGGGGAAGGRFEGR